MPGGDGTGPMGGGSMSGRGAGFCAGFDVPGYANPVPGRGFWGRGFGRGGRCGGGRGWRRWYYATGLPGWLRFGQQDAETEPAPSGAEKRVLEAQAKAIQAQLDAIQARLNALDSADTSK